MYQVIHSYPSGRYVYAKTEPPHPRRNSNGVYPLHRVVAENTIGRALRADEVVHHIDGNRANNSPENLAVMTRAEHTSEHRPNFTLEPFACAWCDGVGSGKPHLLRLRRKRNRSGLLFCSLSCGTQYQHRSTAG